MTEKTVVMEHLGEGEPSDYSEADDAFDDYMDSLKESLQEYQDSSCNWKKDIKRLKNLIESDKVVQLTDSGAFIMTLPIGEDYKLQAARYDARKFDIVSFDIDVENMKMKIHIKRRD